MEKKHMYYHHHHTAAAFFFPSSFCCRCIACQCLSPLEDFVFLLMGFCIELFVSSEAVMLLVLASYGLSCSYLVLFWLSPKKFSVSFLAHTFFFSSSFLVLSCLCLEPVFFLFSCLRLLVYLLLLLLYHYLFSPLSISHPLTLSTFICDMLFLVSLKESNDFPIIAQLSPLPSMSGPIFLLYSTLLFRNITLVSLGYYLSALLRSDPFNSASHIL
ncbi:hypothetical protein L228DRAFT_61958 [Xylona heveae TC161]|uniref:Uncharacterized protein n=1 Tax=Xylona heveae (strain CBS 132557 / TC161) TaxID=1328760 RepID=A0A165IM54_XYLHT|nr:hypothetical protein L228DRAFT_61958 [Xylona heveae TC161]KZF25096.1 hypothetical protein L228DRAFT_61958 [Xylona heveae TC161]